MPTEITRLSDLDAREREHAIGQAADALREGRLVVLPTETVYGVFAAANQPEAVARLTEAWDGASEHAASNPDAPTFFWHAGSRDEVVERVDLPTPVARRLVSRLMPGPARFEIEQDEPTLAALRDGLGVAPGVIDAGGTLAVRVPDHAACTSVLERAGVPAVALGLSMASFAGAGAGANASIDESAAIQPGVVVDDGPTRFAKPSTLIKLGLDGKFEVGAGGALDESAVLGALERTVLFVCTGNTCRSPMARAIAQKLIDEREYEGITTHAESAGVAAGPGVPASADAVEVLGAMGIDLRDHRSQPITRMMIREADVVYTMTPSHAEAVMTMMPEAAEKIFPLDPRGVIEDPIGQGRDVYERTARRLEELIRQRLEELDR
ncbi:MAG: Sua5/YciO/YrdC/YwlC family protein [Phycisphaerales bacterium]